MGSSRRNTPYDWALLAVALAVSVPFIVANLALVLFHKRKYFRAHGGVTLVVGSSLAGLIWIYSCFLNNDHFTRPRFFKACVFWTFWSQGLSGCLWFIFNLVRLHRIYLLSREKDAWCWGYLFLTGLFLLPLGVLSILSTKYHAFDADSCNMKKNWEVASWIVIYALYLTVSVIILCMLRGETDPLFVREHMHTSEYIILALVIVLASGSATLSDGTLTVYGRCFLTFGTCSLVFMHFWSRFGWPVYLCLFRPKSEMDRLEQELTLSGARALQVLSTPYSQRVPLQSSEGAVLEAYVKAIQVVEDIKDKIRKMEQQKEILQEKNRELQLRRSNQRGLTLSEIIP